MQPMTIRLPDDLYEHYRTRAFHERTSISSLMLAALWSEVDPDQTAEPNHEWWDDRTYQDNVTKTPEEER